MIPKRGNERDPCPGVRALYFCWLLQDKKEKKEKKEKKDKKDKKEKKDQRGTEGQRAEIARYR